MDRCARVSISPGSRMRCAIIGATLPLLDALGHLAKPGAMMFPGPPRSDPATRHRANRAFDPDSCVDVHDDRTNEYETEKRMRQRTEPYHVDGEIAGEVLSPDDDTARQQAREAHNDGKEQNLLTTVVAADIRQVLLAVIHYVADPAQPQPVPPLQRVVAPQFNAEQQECSDHEAADEGMQDSRPGSATKQIGQPEQRWMKQREPGQCQQYEADRNEPMIDAGGGAISLDPPRIARAHDVFSRSRRAASSSCSSVSLGPMPM